MDVATLRERVSRESANSMSSGGRGPLSVGIRPVRACSILARLIFRGDQGGLGFVFEELILGQCVGALRSPDLPTSRCHVHAKVAPLYRLRPSKRLPSTSRASLLLHGPTLRITPCQLSQMYLFAGRRLQTSSSSSSNTT
jgi:hypothetical protein